MPAAYFISDVHLGLEDPGTEALKQRRLLSFLGHVSSDASHLFILGDLFDAWIEYRTVVPRGFHRVLARLHDLAEGGVEIHFLAGNHDFWIRDHLSGDLGIKTHREAFGIELNGKKLYLHHGDGLDPRDRGYLFLRKVLRNRLSIWLFSWLHPDIGVALARSSSRASRGYTSAKEYGGDDWMRRAAAGLIGEGYHAVIMGHRHVPCETAVGAGTYLNLGDWITHNTYARLSPDGTLSLQTWNPA
jgi:UDP-2,3-diacylglucosamine hydrolase